MCIMLFIGENSASFFSKPFWQEFLPCCYNQGTQVFLPGQGERNLTTRYEAEVQVGFNAGPQLFGTAAGFGVGEKM